MYHPNNFFLLPIDLNEFWTCNKDAIIYYDYIATATD